MAAWPAAGRKAERLGLLWLGRRGPQLVVPTQCRGLDGVEGGERVPLVVVVEAGQAQHLAERGGVEARAERVGGGVEEAVGPEELDELAREAGEEG